MKINEDIDKRIRPFYLYKSKDKIETYKKIYDRKCKYCGYTNRIINKYKRIICKNCGNYVFLNDKEEFKYRMKEYL